VHHERLNWNKGEETSLIRRVFNPFMSVTRSLLTQTPQVPAGACKSGQATSMKRNLVGMALESINVVTGNRQIFLLHFPHEFRIIIPTC